MTIIDDDTFEKEWAMYEETARNEDIDPEAFEAFCRNQHISAEDCADAVQDFMDAYMGEWEDEATFTQSFYEDGGLLNPFTTGIPSEILSHIDWQGVWDSELRHHYYEINGYYFRNI